MEYLQTISIIVIIKLIVLIVVTCHGGCLLVFHIQNNWLLGGPLRYLIFWFMVLIPTRTISIGLAVPFFMTILSTIVASDILPLI